MEGTTVLEHLNFFNKVISELLVIDVKIDAEDKMLILLSLFPESCGHIVTTMLYSKETLILEVMPTLLSNEKRPNQEEQTGSGLVVTGRKGREGRKGSSSSKACHFCHREVNWKNDCKHRKEWLKKKGQPAEADVASGVKDTEILIISYEDNTSQGKTWIFDSGSTIHVYS